MGPSMSTAAVWEIAGIPARGSRSASDTRRVNFRVGTRISRDRPVSPFCFQLPLTCLQRLAVQARERLIGVGGERDEVHALVWLLLVFSGQNIVAEVRDIRSFAAVIVTFEVKFRRFERVPVLLETFCFCPRKFKYALLWIGERN